MNDAYYRDVLLGHNHLSAIRSTAEETFTFQQNNALTHQERNTVEYLSNTHLLSFHHR